VQKLGTPLAAAILGSVLNSGYSDGLRLDGLPDEVAAAARDSVYAGAAVAEQLGSADLLGQVRAAFVDGLDQMLWVSAAVAALGMLLTVLFLPARAPRLVAEEAEQAESGHVRITG